MISGIVIIDAGMGTSVCSSIVAADLLAQKAPRVYFVTSAKYTAYAARFLSLSFIDIASLTTAPAASCVIDLTLPGEGLSQTSQFLSQSHQFYRSHKGTHAQNLLSCKAEFIEQVTGEKELLKELTSQKRTPLLTYSADLAALFNMQGVPTIELCYRYRKPGSFLPGSLVITGDAFGFLQKEDLDLLFQFYQLGKIEDFFLNRSVLEVDWDILHYKVDKMKSSILTQNYPPSAMESFIDQFFRGFLSERGTQTFSMDRMLKLSQKMDAIDLETTLEFVSKVLTKCLEDVEEDNYPFTGSHWNWIRGYTDCYSRQKLTSLRKSLSQALIGLELFLKIDGRQRRISGMH